jgi:hypothetical protein
MFSLERLPFADNEFDFVHMFATCFCIPEDKVSLLPCLTGSVLHINYDKVVFRIRSKSSSSFVSHISQMQLDYRRYLVF